MAIKCKHFHTNLIKSNSVKISYEMSNSRLAVSISACTSAALLSRQKVSYKTDLLKAA